MKKKKKKLENSQVEVLAEVKGDDYKKAEEKALKKLASRLNIKGFRKGKAPLNIAKDHISKGELINETINESLNPAYQEAIKEHSLRPIAQPEVNVVDFKEDELIKLSFKVSVEPEVTLGEYKGINIPLKVEEVSEKEIDETVQNVLNNNSELVLKEGPAEKGDTVVLDFKGYINGKEFDGGSAENYTLVLGSNQFVPGFEDQLVGVTSETKKDVIITFPEQYIKDLAGKEAKFVCMIHEIKTKKVPVLNDEFAKSLNLENVASVENLRKYEQKVLETRKLNQAKNVQFQELINKIVEDSKLDLPEVLVTNEVNAMKQQFLSQLEQSGLTKEQYKEITGNDENSFEAEYRKDAETRLKQELVLNAIARKEHLTITKGDLDDYYANVASQYSMKVEEVKKVFARNEAQIVSNLFNQKITRFLSANNLEEEKKEVNDESPKTEEQKEEGESK